MVRQTRGADDGSEAPIPRIIVETDHLLCSTEGSSETDKE